VSGCCGQSPVVISATQTPARVDVETVLLCDVLPDGTVAAQVLVEPIYDTSNGQRVATRTVDPVTGNAYTVQGTLQPCDGDDCASRTTPITSVGLCLADGTPIAVTVVRDCEGVATSEGWINLTTGAWTAGAVPAGTVACGDSRSIQVSGTFCDLDANGEVVGLVLVEYTYDDTGAISSVRLVDAVTGDTYTPTGTVTVCPAGVEQPEQDAVILCDVQPDGTATQFLRDYRRDEMGAIVAHRDYTLDGADYQPTGSVGLCPPPECETVAVQTLRLCDLNPDVQPDEDGRRCAVPFLRHLTYGCDGALLSSTDTEVDGTTPYTPVAVVDCGEGGVPAQVELVWPQTGIAEDPAGIPQQDFIYTITNPDTDAVAEVRLHASRVAGGNCGPYDPANPTFNNPTVYTLTLDAAAQEMHVFRLDLVDFDTFEGISQLSPPPSRVEGNVTWNGGSTVTANDNNVTAHLYWDNPPAQITYRYGNTGGGTACASVAFQGITLKPEGCCGCAPCNDCETLLLCDEGTAATITGSTASGSLPNGVDWTAQQPNTGQTMPPRLTNSDGTWWGIHSFPNTADAPTRWTFSRPSIVEFSVYLIGSTTNAPSNRAQLPTGLEVLNLPSGYAYDAATGVLTRTPSGTADPCSYVTDPQVEHLPRFRTRGKVTSITTQAGLGSRIAACGSFFTYLAGAISVVPGGQFLRQVCRDCDGRVTSVTDTELDGVTPYTPFGAVGQCTPTPPCDMTVMGECVYSLPDVPLGFDPTSTAFPDCWLATATSPRYTFGDRVTAWEATYQTSTGTISAFGFSSPDLGGEIDFTAFAPAIPTHPTQSPTNYVGTATINGVTVTLRALSGNGVARNADPKRLNVDQGDRYRIEFSRPVRLTLNTTGFGDPPTPHNERFCGVVTETVPWRAVKRADCEGNITVVDADTGAAIPATATLLCDDDCCQPVQVCVAATRTESLEFISNAANATDNSVDPTWKWSPALAGPWYDMYRTPPVGGWITQDGGTPAGTAHWVSAHPNGSPVQSSPPRAGEGPTIGVQTWYARASFNLPDSADPASIRIAATVLNADQNLVAWRLNAGAWQPVGADHTEPPTQFGPTAVPGVRPGTNEIFLEIQETVAGGGGAALMVHLIASYQLPDGQRSWTRMVCCDDTVYYLDEFGARHEELPEFWAVAPCGVGAAPIVLCDDAGSFLRHFSYEGGQVVTADTDLTGGAYTPVGTVRSCSSSTTGPADAPVSTGIRRVTGTAPQDVKAENPGLQSVSVTVLAGVLNVTMSTGAAQAVPAGMTLTWSVADTDDSSLAAASFTGASAATDYVLNWTAKGSAAG